MNVQDAQVCAVQSLLQKKVLKDPDSAINFYIDCHKKRLIFSELLSSNIPFHKAESHGVKYTVRKKPNDKIRYFIDLNEILGKGVSKVVKAYWNLDKGKVVAFGEVFAQPNNIRNVKREFEILTALQEKSSYFIRPKFWIDPIENEEPIMAMECISGTFLDLLKKELSLEQKIEIFRQILSGFAALHKMGYAHRDIKFDNIFYIIDERGEITIKIGDLGFACKNEGEEERKNKIAGTALFLSPEGCKAIYTKEAIDLFKSDCWGIGLLGYTLFKNEPPEQLNNALLKGIDIKDWVIENSRSDGIHGLNREDPIENLIGKMLRVDPEERYSARHALRNLNEIIVKRNSLQSLPKTRGLQAQNPRNYSAPTPPKAPHPTPRASRDSYRQPQVQTSTHSSQKPSAPSKRDAAYDHYPAPKPIRMNRQNQRPIPQVIPATPHPNATKTKSSLSKRSDRSELRHAERN